MNQCYSHRNIVLRKSQVGMVREYVQALRAGSGGMVKQMIMGQGKTTVVCPLLTLMLGDGSHLILQVVPPALLDFSRSVMRSTFSSIMHKRIYTISFDRSSEIEPSMLKKLLHAKRDRGVVICAPTTVKSIMLKVCTVDPPIRLLRRTSNIMSCLCKLLLPSPIRIVFRSLVPFVSALRCFL